MENKSIFTKNFLGLTHLPTFLLILGYIVYWLELYFIKNGQGITSPLAYFLFAIFIIFVLFFKKNQSIKFFLKLFELYKKEGKFNRYILFVALGISIFIGIIVFRALLLPLHLPQEYDALNYHLTLPRQHLILNSFKHIGWSSADLFPIPIQFSLAPYWLIQEIPSKFIQIFFALGLLAVSLSLLSRFNKNAFLSFSIVAIAILGSHNVGIQMPVLMLDIVICYLFIASVDSFLRKRFVLSAVEFTFFIWSKSFYFPQVVLIFILLFLGRFFLKKIRKARVSWVFKVSSRDELISKEALRKMVMYVLCFSIIIGGPFVIKSLYYSGTPLFPFFPGLTNFSCMDKSSTHWQSILLSSQQHLSTKDSYGSGRSLLDFLKHLWIVAVPEEGVMNRYDYPLGLPYLLFIAPFFYCTINAFRKKIFPILPLFAISYWLTWWFGSQQTRFLYIPLIIVFITVTIQVKQPSRLFMLALIFSLCINTVSIFRAHYKDFSKPIIEILREKDKKLIQMNKEYFNKSEKSIVVLDYHDAAYANFPIKVVSNRGLWVL